MSIDYIARKQTELREMRLVLAPELRALPDLNWNEIDARLLHYLMKTVIGTEWLSQLALATIVLSQYAQQKMMTVRVSLQILHGGFTTIRDQYPLTSFAAWDPSIHMSWYMKGTQLQASRTTRNHFLTKYENTTTWVCSYLNSLSTSHEQQLTRWQLPRLPGGVFKSLSCATQLNQERHIRRKALTDAVALDFAHIRAETHHRWNALLRLRTKFLEAIQLITTGRENIPLRFSYEEGQERLHFVVWSRQAFVAQYAARYSMYSQWEVRKMKEDFHFLEFVGVEDGSSTHNAEHLLWFGELLHSSMFSDVGKQRQKREQIEDFLQAWGYAAGSQPFTANTPGLLQFPLAFVGFLHKAQQICTNLLFMIEPLFMAATFGLVALELITTTGIRINEMQQISLTPECLHTIIADDHKRYLLRVVPKGRHTCEEYFISSEAKRIIETLVTLLQQHYGVPPHSTLPSVPFRHYSSRGNEFPARPYLFQYDGRHLSENSINASLRFLCHGLVRMTHEGHEVILSSHLFRHAFATHAAQVVSIDILMKILHHRDRTSTAYYSEPTHHEVQQQLTSFLDHWSTHLGDLASQRGPEELQQQLEEARSSIGTLARVIGGECTCHAICPFSYTCVGCVHKVPDPRRRSELDYFRKVTMIRLDQVTQRKLLPEIAQQQLTLQRCDNELGEMDLIEAYQHDEALTPSLEVEYE